MNLSNKKGPLFMVAAAICWSFGGLCIKFIPWDAMTIVGIRAFLAAIVFAVYRRSIKFELTCGNALSAVCLALTTILFVFANKLTTAAAAIILQFTAPIFIILLELFFYRKKPKLIDVLAVFMVLFGIALLFAEQLSVGGLWGNLLAVASGVFFAGVFVCNKRSDTNTAQALFMGFLINTIIGLPFAAYGVTADLAAIIAVLFLGIVQVGLAYVFFAKGILYTPALFACLITAVEPMLNPVWVALVTNEIPGVTAVIGGVIIIATVISYNIYQSLWRN